MAIRFLDLGKSILSAAGKGSKVTVRYNAKALQDLKGTKLAPMIEDAFTGCRRPSLEVSSNPASQHNMISMITRDGDEVITNNTFRLGKDDSILNYLLDAKECSVKTVLNRQEAEKLITSDKNLQGYFAEHFGKAKNPMVEVATKSNGKYNVTVMTLKDGDNVLARGAYSQASGDVCKYHFTDGKTLNTGFLENGVAKHKKLGLFPKDLLEKYKLLGDNILYQREKWMLDSRYGLNGQNHSSFRKIGEEWDLGPERVRQIIIKALKKLEDYPIDSEAVKLYKANRKVPKYLDEREAYRYKDYCHRLFSKNDSIRTDALADIQRYQELSNARMQEKINRVINS